MKIALNSSPKGIALFYCKNTGNIQGKKVEGIILVCVFDTPQTTERNFSDSKPVTKRSEISWSLSEIEVKFLKWS
jgi:predicted RNA-binding protein with PUA-like domain